MLHDIMHAHLELAQCDSLKIGLLYIPLYGLFETLYQIIKKGQQRVCQFENWLLGKEDRNISRQH